ncbi:MAG TPA: cytochrome C oxidase subunit IV family protein [Candidatus Angelobacter sp.]|nr:cytochrome C oxidase subunit IV family protein [Candidatus Angelobacter sp.]
MSEQHTEHPDHFASHVRRYLLVFVALIFGTILTVWASYIRFPTREINVAVALFIAASKASLVAGFFMHLISERKMIYGILCFTAFFFAGLMALTIWSFADFPALTVTH